MVEKAGVGEVDLILADLGVSSSQLTDVGTGLSFQENMPLDMRLDKRLKTQDTIDLIQRIVDKGYLDEEEIEERMIDTSSVLQTGRYTIPEYMNAIEFTTYRLQEQSQVEAYRRTFPDRCEGKTPGAIAGKASIYGNGKLVTQMLTIAQVPISILYMRERHKAIRKLAYLTDNADTERLQMESADKLLNHIKPPEEIKLELEVGLGAAAALDELKESLDSIATMARRKLDSGVIDAKVLIER